MKFEAPAEGRLELTQSVPLPLRPRHTGAAVILHKPGARKIEYRA
jgi:hypothetical protein